MVCTGMLHWFNTSVYKFGISNIYLAYFWKTFIQQRHIKLIKSDTKGIYNVTTDFYFK